MSTLFFGQVIGTAMQKTIKVRVERIKIHPIVQKPVRLHKNFLVHDELQECVVGDYVSIIPCGKISKLKHFKLQDIVTRADKCFDSQGRLITSNAVVKKVPEEYNIDQYQ